MRQQSGVRTAMVLATILAAWTAGGCDEREPAGAPTQATEAAPAQTLPVADVEALRRIVADNAAAGRVTVIDFWATWCIPCIEIFPELHASLHAMGDRVVPISVTLDSPGKYEQKAIAFLEEHEAREGAYILPAAVEAQERVIDELGEKWNDFVVPAILVFDREGKLAGEFLGNVEAQPANVIERVRELLPAPGSSAPPQAGGAGAMEGS